MSASEGRVEQGPPVERLPSPVLRRRALAQLRQAVWEATQFCGYTEIEHYVGEVLTEIESDEP